MPIDTPDKPAAAHDHETLLARLALQQAPVATMVLDGEHRVTVWNDACAALTGIAATEVLGRPLAWRALYAQARPTPADELIDAPDAQTAAVGEAMHAIEHFQARAGQGGRWLRARAKRLEDDHGRCIGAVQTIEDESTLRRMTEELARLRERTEQVIAVRSAELTVRVRELDAFVTSAPIGVAFCAEGVIKRVNHALARMLGATEEALHGQPDALFRGDPAARSKDDPGGDDDGTWVRHRTTGRSLWLQLDEHQTGQGTWWMVQDRTDYRTAQRQLLTRVTELRETNERLAEAQNKLLQQEKMASIGQLAAGVAHEINNPVGFVNSNLNTLRQNVDDLMRLVQAQAEALEAADPALGEKPRRLGEEIDITYLREDLPVLLAECAEGLDRVRKIVQDLKDFSRVDNLDWQAADLISGLESTLNVVRHEVRYRADVVRKIEPLPLVQCLPAQINQVFMNLIVNAAQAIENHGTITLSSGVVDGWVWVQVDDTGCGMSEDVRRRIFEPFFTTKDVGKGTGLGLSLSFSIIDKHGGQIQVRSVPGEGSSFRVWLPVDGPKQGQRREPPAWT